MDSSTGFVTVTGPTPRRGAARSSTWWGKAWVRSFEETSLGEKDLAAGRRIARSGLVTAIDLGPGAAVARIPEPRGGSQLARLAVAALDDRQWADFVVEAARSSGYAAELVAGVLPAGLVEHADQVGVELLPGPADLDSACDCDFWAQPCRHALALMYLVAWLIDQDPFRLLLLRGRSREDLLAAVGNHLDAVVGLDAVAGEIDPVADAADRASRIVALSESAPAGSGLVDTTVAAYDEAVLDLLAEPL